MDYLDIFLINMKPLETKELNDCKFISNKLTRFIN